MEEKEEEEGSHWESRVLYFISFGFIAFHKKISGGFRIVAKSQVARVAMILQRAH